MFFVHEKDNLYSYIFLLTEKRKYAESVDNIIEVMSRLKLNIKGRRYFKGFNPLFNADDLSSKERSWVYPPIDPYSITVVRKNIEEKFDWGSELRRLANEY